MFRVEVHQNVKRITSVFYGVGAWHREDEAAIGELRLKLLYSFYSFLYIVSIIAGALDSANIGELILSVEFTLLDIVLFVKFLYIIWTKKEVLQLLNRICVYSVEDEETFRQVNDESNILMKFVVVFLSLAYINATCVAIVVPFLESGKTLFINIGFPLDWKNNEIAYWIAFTFMASQVVIVSIAVLFSVITWYLMSNCGIRFEVLGKQIRAMGQGSKVKSVERNTEQDDLYLRDLLDCIESHIHLKELTNELENFLSELLVAQLTTSALCICCSIYSTAFSQYVTSAEYFVNVVALLFSIFDIFMIMYFGNKVQIASGRLSYCLFESEWMSRPQSTKKIVIIFGELLMKPHKLVVLRLYPLNLETFMRILNSAYSTFNILQSFK